MYNLKFNLPHFYGSKTKLCPANFNFQFVCSNNAKTYRPAWVGCWRFTLLSSFYCHRLTSNQCMTVLNKPPQSFRHKFINATCIGQAASAGLFRAVPVFSNTVEHFQKKILLLPPTNTLKNITAFKFLNVLPNSSLHNFKILQSSWKALLW